MSAIHLEPAFKGPMLDLLKIAAHVQILHLTLHSLRTFRPLILHRSNVTVAHYRLAKMLDAMLCKVAC